LDYLPLLFFVFSVDAMLLFSMRTGLLWIGGFILINGAYFIYYFGWREGLETLAIFGSGYIFFGVFANALYRSQEAQLKSQKLLKELEAANRQLKDYTKQVETLTAAQERNRLAREMHDTVGHHLTVVAVQLEGAQRLIKADSEKASALITTAREQVRLALQEARQTVSRLRSPLEADLPLAQSLEQLTADFQDATGLVIHLTLPEEILFLPESHRLALYRSAQEALTNVQRHAQARVVDVDLRQGEDEITLRIRDDGIGGNLASETQGYGLLGLKERAAQLGGTAEWYDRCMADSTQHGLELVIRLPMMGSKNG
jgi:signal transduction histidine kinase